MPLRDTYESSRDVNGRIKFKGNPIKRRKGIPYKVDCNVTGSDRGTPTAPKFALKDLWEYTLIPSIEKLVAEGGPCEGATVIFQEDNAGPHCDATYRDFLQKAFEERQWLIELQAPQGKTTPPLLHTYHRYELLMIFLCRPLHECA